MSQSTGKMSRHYAWSRLSWYSEMLQTLARQRRAGIVSSVCRGVKHQSLRRCRSSFTEQSQSVSRSWKLMLLSCFSNQKRNLPVTFLTAPSDWLMDGERVSRTHTQTCTSRLQTEKVQIIKQKKTARVALKKLADAVKSQIFSRERVLLPEFLMPTKAKIEPAWKSGEHRESGTL